MKKVLSVLLSLALLCALLPAGGVAVSAATAGNLLKNGDFETYYNNGCAWTYYQNSSHYGEGAALHGFGGGRLAGNGGWGALMEQPVQVTLGQTYHLEFWYKVVQNGFNWRLEQSDSDGLYETRWETATEWTYVSYDFVASSDWITLNFCGGGNGIAEIALVDDLVLCEAAPDGVKNYVKNGGFEYGNLSCWDAYQSTHVCTSAPYAGGYGAHLEGNGGWGALLEQTFTVLPGAEYTVTFRYKVNQNGFNAQVYGGASNQSLASGWYTDALWAEASLTFVADGATARLNFCGGGNGIAESVYIDEVRVTGGENGERNLLNDGNAAWKRASGTAWSDEAYLHGDPAGDMGVKMQSSGDESTMFRRAFSAIPGAQYTFSFWYKAVQNGFQLQIVNPADGTLLHSGRYDAGEWSQETVTFTAPADSFIVSFCGSGAGTADTAYLNQVTLTTDGVAPARTTELKNGGFESGAPLGWSVYQGTSVSQQAAAEGDRGAVLNGNGGWGALLDQGFFTEPNAQYVLTFKYKVLSNGFNVKLVTASGNDPLASGWYTATEWSEASLTFTAKTATTRLNICGGGNGVPEHAYLDCVTLTKVESENPELTYGGSSYSPDVYGLAFRFSLAAEGVTTDSRYQADYTAATVDGKKLVMMGAVLSNNGSDTHLESVNGSHVINVQALKVVDATDGKATFVVRVINIPTDKLERRITARPYYVYEDADGNQMVVYGEEYGDSFMSAL